jgi:hypothetical protein
METITMSPKEQQRAVVLMRWIEGDIDVAAAAALMGCSERSSWRLRASYRREGPASGGPWGACGSSSTAAGTTGWQVADRT